MYRMIALTLALAAGACFLSSGIADDNPQTGDGKEAKFTAKCPVSGAAAKKAMKTAYKDKECYFCCDKCKAAFEADSAKYAVKANHQLVQTKQYRQAKCPFSGGDVDKAQTVKMNGVAVRFCCDKCKAKAEAQSGDDQLALVFSDDAFKKGFVARKAKKTATAGR